LTGNILSPRNVGEPSLTTQNLVLLVREMRAAFGTKYGISLTLAPDNWYLRYFDAKAMEALWISSASCLMVSLIHVS
jgi:hypothetical protein